jgi:hypothetical protein
MSLSWEADIKVDRISVGRAWTGLMAEDRNIWRDIELYGFHRGVVGTFALLACNVACVGSC